MLQSPSLCHESNPVLYAILSRDMPLLKSDFFLAIGTLVWLFAGLFAELWGNLIHLDIQYMQTRTDGFLTKYRASSINALFCHMIRLN